MDLLGITAFVDESDMARNMQVLRGSTPFGWPNDILTRQTGAIANDRRGTDCIVLRALRLSESCARNFASL